MPHYVHNYRHELVKGKTWTSKFWLQLAAGEISLSDAWRDRDEQLAIAALAEAKRAEAEAQDLLSQFSKNKQRRLREEALAQAELSGCDQKCQD